MQPKEKWQLEAFGKQNRRKGRERGVVLEHRRVEMLE
jgi:hypothetical protein